MASQNHYEVLGVDKSANDQQLRAAYRKLALKWHPDKNDDSAKSNEVFRAVHEAWEILSDEKKRTKYDKDLQVGTETKIETRTSRPHGPFAKTPSTAQPSTGRTYSSDSSAPRPNTSRSRTATGSFATASASGSFQYSSHTSNYGRPSTRRSATSYSTSTAETPQPRAAPKSSFTNHYSKYDSERQRANTAAYREPKPHSRVPRRSSSTTSSGSDGCTAETPQPRSAPKSSFMNRYSKYDTERQRVQTASHRESKPRSRVHPSRLTSTTYSGSTFVAAEPSHSQRSGQDFERRRARRDSVTERSHIGSSFKLGLMSSKGKFFEIESISNLNGDSSSSDSDLEPGDVDVRARSSSHRRYENSERSRSYKDREGRDPRRKFSFISEVAKMAVRALDEAEEMLHRK